MHLLGEDDLLDAEILPEKIALIDSHVRELEMQMGSQACWDVWWWKGKA